MRVKKSTILSMIAISVIMLAVPSALAWAIPTTERSISATDTSYASIYENNQRAVNPHVGMSILPDGKKLDSKSYYQIASASGGKSTRSLIPNYLIDEYMKRSPQSTVQTTNYTIQKGDTLYRIANFFDVSVDMLILQNRISDPTKLRIGQRLIIPAPNQEVTTWLSEDSAISDVFYATLTAYTAGFESTGKNPSHPEYGITASGAKVKENHTIAVDPDVIPLGTLVYIDGIGIRKAEDIGSAIKGHKIDIYIPDLEEALEFGVKKNVKVYVLGKEKKQDVQIASAKP